MKKALCLLVTMALFAAAALPAYADEADIAKGDSSIEITEEYAAEVREMRGEGILDSEELDRMVDAFVEEHRVKKENFSIGYCYLETGDEYFYNGDSWYYPGSVYKVPLMMLIAEKVSAGELEQDGDFMGLPLSTVEEYILTYSNNDWAHNVRRWLHDGAGDQVWRKAAMGYADLDESYYSTDYTDYCYYSARYITKVLETLYFGGEERFPNVIPCMLNGNPVNYFKLSDQMRQYEIAQKYGSFVDFNNRNWNATVGIIYTDHPFILSVLTLDAPSSEKVLSDAAILFTDYTLQVDDRLDAFRAAQAQADQQRREEEQAAEEERQIEQQVAEERQIEQQKQEQRAEKQKTIRSAALIVGIAGGALALGLILGAVLTARRNKRKRYEAYRRRFEAELREEERQPRAGRASADDAGRGAQSVRPRQSGAHSQTRQRQASEPRRRTGNERPRRPRPEYRDPEE